MLKIDERLDLSKMVLDIDINSPVFSEMLDNLNVEIQRTIKKVYDKDFSAGEITLKLNIEIPNGYKYFPKTNEFGEMVEETYVYRQPNFKHTVTTTLKKQFKQEGIYSAEKEVVLDESGKFTVVPIKDPQVRIDDIE